jgi:general secretion pathway protein E
MIGEIRDEETAGIAIRAGLTGHLILSTVHAPSAAGVFARMVDLGCEPFLTASAISAVLAQRLIRTICPECRKPAAPTAPQLERLRIHSTEGEWSRGTGCGHCGGTGYRGRTGIFELLEVTEAVREAVLAGGTTTAVERAANREGRGLSDGALAAARAGATSLDEVMRVLGG